MGYSCNKDGILHKIFLIPCHRTLEGNGLISGWQLPFCMYFCATSRIKNQSTRNMRRSAHLYGIFLLPPTLLVSQSVVNRLS